MNWKNILNVAGSVGSAASPWLGAATGVLGSILGSKSQSKANEANLQMTRETNLANQAMNNANIDAARSNLYYQTAQNMAEAKRGRDFEAQQAELARQFNASEAAKAREYASAKNEVARMLGAGLNPAAINGNGEGQAIMASGSPVGSAPVGSAGTQSLPSSIPMQAGHVEPVMNQLAAVGSLLQDSYRISRDIAQQERNRGTTERGQSLDRISREEANKAAQTAADAAAKNAETSAHIAEYEMQNIASQIEDREFQQFIASERLEIEKLLADNGQRLSKAQASSLYGNLQLAFNDLEIRRDLAEDEIKSGISERRTAVSQRSYLRQLTARTRQEAQKAFYDKLEFIRDSGLRRRLAQNLANKYARESQSRIQQWLDIGSMLGRNSTTN